MVKLIHVKKCLFCVTNLLCRSLLSMSISASLQDLDNPENFHSLFNLVEADPMRQQNMLGDVGFDIFN